MPIATARTTGRSGRERESGPVGRGISRGQIHGAAGVDRREQEYQSAALTQVQADVQRFTDTAALFRALGGGWWNPRDRSSARGVCHPRAPTIPTQREQP